MIFAVGGRLVTVGEFLYLLKLFTENHKQQCFRPQQQASSASRVATIGQLTEK